MNVKSAVIGFFAASALVVTAVMAATPSGARLVQGQTGGDGLASDTSLYATLDPVAVSRNALEEAAIRNSNKLVDFVSRMHFDVTTFGAVPDDSSDDALEINAAIDAAAAAGGGTVFIPKGVWIVSEGSIKLKKTVRVVGAGMDATIIRLGIDPTGNGSNPDWVFYNTTDHDGYAQGGAYTIMCADYTEVDKSPADDSGFYVSDLTIDGDQDTLDITANGIHGLTFIQCSDIVVERVRAIDCGDNVGDTPGVRGLGIATFGGWNVTIRDCETYRNGYGGIEARQAGDGGTATEYGSRDILVTGCRCYNDARHAIAAQPETEGMVIENVFTDQWEAAEGGDGIIVHRGRNILVNNFHSKTRQGGLYIHDSVSSIQADSTYNVTYSNGLVECSGDRTENLLSSSTFVNGSSGSFLTTAAGFIYSEKNGSDYFVHDITFSNITVIQTGVTPGRDYGIVVASPIKNFKMNNVRVYSQANPALLLIGGVEDFTATNCHFENAFSSGSSKAGSVVLIGDYDSDGGDWAVAPVRTSFVGCTFKGTENTINALAYCSNYTNLRFTSCTFLGQTGNGGTSDRCISLFRSSDTTAANRDGLYVTGCTFVGSRGIRMNGTNAQGNNFAFVGNDFIGCDTKLDVATGLAGGEYRVQSNTGVSDTDTAP